VFYPLNYGDKLGQLSVARVRPGANHLLEGFDISARIWSNQQSRRDLSIIIMFEFVFRFPAAAAATLIIFCSAAAEIQAQTKAGETRIFGEIEFAWCPAGEFLMGSPESEEGRSADEKVHKVILTQGFWMARTETTQKQWKAVMGGGNNPSEWSGLTDLPVENVHWGDAIGFCARINQKFDGDLPEGFKFTLPTEAQWEYACRAGTTTPFSFGATLTSRQANFDGSEPYGVEEEGPFIEKTSKAKSFQPNAWGIYDMHGNLAEWCLDGFAAYEGEATDPLAPATGLYRILRGGSWRSEGAFLRSAYRSRPKPELKLNNIGFRIVLSIYENK
jgi:sulfatase modifying factor 1